MQLQTCWMPWQWLKDESGCCQGPGITVYGARCAQCMGSTAAVPHSRLFYYLEAAASLAEAQVRLAGIFLSAPFSPVQPPNGPSRSPCNPLPSCCFDTLVYRGHTLEGRKCQSGEKFDRSLTRQPNNQQISQCNTERSI